MSNAEIAESSVNTEPGNNIAQTVSSVVVRFAGDSGDGMQLTGANFTWTSAEGANFTRSTLKKAGFKMSHLLRANFGRANLTGANFTNACIARANFIESNLSGVMFKKANIARTEFFNADMFNANLRGVKVTASQLAFTKNLEFAHLTPGRYADAMAARNMMFKIGR